MLMIALFDEPNLRCGLVYSRCIASVQWIEESAVAVEIVALRWRFAGVPARWRDRRHDEPDRESRVTCHSPARARA